MYRMLLILFSTIVLVSCSNSDSNFQQIGYFKADNKLRYFTFQIRDPMGSTQTNLSVGLRSDIEKHGKEQMNTNGQITSSFYYLYPNKAPDITNMSAQKAKDAAHNHKPIVAIWIMPAGQVNVINNPK